MRRSRLLWIAAIVAALSVIPSLAQRAAPSVLVDRSEGEDEQIEKRLAWFLSTRTAGVESIDEIQTLRQRALEQVAERVERQRWQRSHGFEDSTNFWMEMGPSPSHFGGWAIGDVAGRITGIAKGSDGTLYVATAAGGAWKSTNDGLSWTSLLDAFGTQPTGAIAVDPNDPDVLWVGTGDYNSGCSGYFGIGMLRSTDGGANWEDRSGTSGTLLDMASFSAIIVNSRDSNHVIAVADARGCEDGSASAGGVFTTDDGGLTWTERLQATVYDLQQDQQNQDVYWIATSGGIYKSTDNAATWTKQTASTLPSSGTGRTEVAVAPSNGQVVYALFQDGNSNSAEFWRTTNGGGDWTLMSSGSSACDGQCSYNMTIRVDRTDPDTVYRGTVLLFKSTDGGAGWTQLINGWGGAQQVHQDIQELMVDPVAADTFYVGGDGGLWKSANGGSSFSNLNGNLNSFLFYAIGVHPSDPGTMCGGAQDNSSVARESSNVWDLQAVTGDGFVCHINPVETNYAYIASYPSGGFPHVSRSTSGIFGSFGGITGSGNGIISGDRINWVTPYILDPVTPSTLYLGTHRIYKSIDYGSNWEQVGPVDVTGGSGTVFALEVNRNFPEVVYSGSTSGRIYRSTDFGENWTDITSGLPGRPIDDIAADPTDAGRAFTVVGGFNGPHLYEWNEGGSWVSRGDDLPNVPANTVVMLDSTEMYVGTDVGVFRSTDGGVTTTPFMDGMPVGAVVTDLKYNGALDLLTAGTYGRGAWQIAVDPVAPILLFDSIDLPPVEVDGDGDGNVEPGETWQVTPRLRNVGGITANGVSARLSTSGGDVTINAPAVGDFGDVAGGATAAPAIPFTFTVSPDFPCDGTIVFDLVDVTSTNSPFTYGDVTGAFSITVVDSYEPSIPTALLEEDFDPNPASGWTHESINPLLVGCYQPYKDLWKFASKDGAHGDSFHCGNGPGTTYPRYVYSWLYHGGKDSEGGPGIDVPSGAVTARLEITHWYDIQSGDGGQVAVDGTVDGNDSYVALDPTGGYPGTAGESCSGLQGAEAFTGSSGGWTTSTFDLTPYIGKKIYLAFIFAAGNVSGTNEGWYVDDINVVSEELGASICHVTFWPGSVPEDVRFNQVGGGQIEAVWGDACNVGELPGQLYSIQAGDLDLLAAGGGYSHEPVGSDCTLSSPATFPSGVGNEYYLVISNEGGREGDAGAATGGARPQTSTTCGERRVPDCP